MAMGKIDMINRPKLTLNYSGVITGFKYVLYGPPMIIYHPNRWRWVKRQRVFK